MSIINAVGIGLTKRFKADEHEQEYNAVSHNAIIDKKSKGCHAEPVEA